MEEEQAALSLTCSKIDQNTQTWNFETFGHLISYSHYLEFTQFLPSSNCAHCSQCDSEHAALMTGSESPAKYGHVMKES
jgi:hypothetical protein